LTVHSQSIQSLLTSPNAQKAGGTTNTAKTWQTINSPKASKVGKCFEKLSSI